MKFSWRHASLAILIVAASIVGFAGIRQVADRNAERESAQRATVASLQIQGALDRGTGYIDALRRYLVHQPSVTNDAWVRYVRDSLAGFGLTEGGWMQEVTDAQRPAYERETGRPIRENGPGGKLVRAARRPVYYPATLVATAGPDMRGVDQGPTPQLREVFQGESVRFGVTIARPIVWEGQDTYTLVEAAPRMTEAGPVPGFILVCLPKDWFDKALAGPLSDGTRMRFTDAPGAVDPGRPTSTFTALGRHWAISVPPAPAQGAAVALSWAVLAGGSLLGMLVALLGVGAAKRRRTEDDLDRTEEQRSRLEAELRQAQKLEAVGRLAGGIAHDFNNMLTAIGGFSELVLKEASDAGQVRRDVEEIRRSCDRATALTRQLLVFSRRSVPRIESLDLNDIVTNMDRLLRRLLGSDVELLTILQPEIGRIDGDRSQFEQLIVNLAVNARDAMPNGGKLVIRTDRLDGAGSSGPENADAPGPQVVLTVEDNGTGMDEATRARMFDPFFTTKEVGQGTGLGLASVWGTVELAGGRVLVDSEPGGGTTFTILLPARTALPEGTAAVVPNGAAAVLGVVSSSSDAAPEAAGRRVLIVEDDAVLRSLAARFLRDGGYEVVEAPYSSAALELYRERGEAVDVLLTDVVMPGMSGVELASRMVDVNPRIAVVVMSGYAGGNDVSRLHHLGAAFLEKPFDSNRLLNSVRAAFDLSTRRGETPSGERVVDRGP